jgi:hypothetical protein
LYADASPAGRLEAMGVIGARFLLLPAKSPELSKDWIEAGFSHRGCLDLAEGRRKGLWGRNSYRPDYPCILLLEASDQQASLAARGTIEELRPNRLRVVLDGKGEAVVRFLHSPRWQGQADVQVDALPGAIPWIRVRGRPDISVELCFGK